MGKLLSKVKKLTSFSGLAEGRDKGLLKDLFGKTVTWCGVENASLGKSTVPVVIFKEYPDRFFFGGQAFRDIVNELDNEDIEELFNDGIKIMMTSQPVKSDNARTFTKITVVEDGE